MNWIAENANAVTLAFMLLALIVCGVWIIIGIIGARTADPYPFDDPDFVHVGMTPALQNIVLKIPTVNLSVLPFNRSVTHDETYYAMTREQFLKFHAEVMKFTREKIADAAHKQEAFLRGDAMILSEFVIGLAPIKERLAPGASNAEAEQIVRACNLVAVGPGP